jgi:hypothetical protein
MIPNMQGRYDSAMRPPQRAYEGAEWITIGLLRELAGRMPETVQQKMKMAG